MTAPIRLVLAIHNHQPVGNFDGVFEQAYQDSYRPFLDVFERYGDLRIALHTSGSLMKWLDAHHPEYVEKLAALVAAGRVEIIGGAFYEPILAMIPRADRVGQITLYGRWLENRFATEVRGMWVPERVWEATMTADLVEAGVEYTLLDDFHFKSAGLLDEQLRGYYLTEDEGRVLGIFPGSERLRYTIPFADPQETIAYLRQIHVQCPGAVIVFGDDGEKFGTWPETKRHVYDDGWLERFFQSLTEHNEWLQVCTLGEAFDSAAPAGKIYLPDCSYREMTEWALPAARLIQFQEITHQMQRDPHWEQLRPFIRGGFWRNFKVKYSEANEMYARMMLLSRRLEQTAEGPHRGDLLELARTELYRAQCNCGYWHGAFGGIYLPHLRGAVYNHLIAADNLLDQATNRTGPRIEDTSGDFDFDARQEVCLANDQLLAFIAPHRGGQIYELDVRSICLNLLATLARRPEAYHRQVLAGQSGGDSAAASIHDRVVFKQAGLDQRLQYDAYPPKSLLDHFYHPDVSPDDIAVGKAHERGDFLQAAYQARVRRSADRIQVQLSREGRFDDTPVKITKSVTLAAGSSTLEIGYLLEGLPADARPRFAVEFNLAGLPAGADDRYFHDGQENQLGQLGSRLRLKDAMSLGLTDEWQGIDVRLSLSRPAGIWTHPIETVSQSESGFELVHQSVVVMPHWLVAPDAGGRWSMTMQWTVDTSLARQRMEQAVHAVTT